MKPGVWVHPSICLAATSTGIGPQTSPVHASEHSQSPIIKLGRGGLHSRIATQRYVFGPIVISPLPKAQDPPICTWTYTSTLLVICQETMSWCLTLSKFHMVLSCGTDYYISASTGPSPITSACTSTLKVTCHGTMS